ncbi:MAG: hypothetical protein Q9171_004370 [Xanthocarpia ochracea]
MSNGHTHDDGIQSFSSSDSSDASTLYQRSSVTGKKKLGKLASRTKQTTKRLFSVGDQQGKCPDQTLMSDPATRVLKHDPAFNPNQLDSPHQSQKRLAAKVQANLQTFTAAILHPKEGAKGKASRSTAGRLSKVQRPYVSKDMDMEFLEAHDNLSQAQSTASSDQRTSGDDSESLEGDWREKVEQLEAQRESMKAAYTLSRHVQRVRVVPKRHIDIPDEEYFVERNDRVKNRYFPSSVEALRASMHRAHDQRSKAYKLGELVDKYGQKHWLEPLIDKLGPFVQLQLYDMANMLEVLAK